MYACMCVHALYTFMYTVAGVRWQQMMMAVGNWNLRMLLRIEGFCLLLVWFWLLVWKLCLPCRAHLEARYRQGCDFWSEWALKCCHAFKPFHFTKRTLTRSHLSVKGNVVLDILPLPPRIMSPSPSALLCARRISLLRTASSWAP